MPLITCPDCERQISNRVNACPFCGCPSKYFNNERIMDAEPAVPRQQLNEIKQLLSEVHPEEFAPTDCVEFKFGKLLIVYPKEMEIYAKLYGNYCCVADQLYDKYKSQYIAAGDIKTVLSNTTEQVENDLGLTVNQAVKDLYSHGVVITQANFIDKYKINFQESIISIYEQVYSVQQESNDLKYKREVEKASRGKWQGGGFGLSGAIKGAATAGLLNAGSGLIHSIGDGIGKSSDNRYIKNKLNDIYKNANNQKQFANCVYACVFDILFGIKQELINSELIGKELFVGENEISSLYEATIKYEKNHEKLFENMVKCFRLEPELRKYYSPILNDLFTYDCDLEAFLEFWNLQSMYQKFESEYLHRLSNSQHNPFVITRCNIAVELGNKLEKCDNGIIVTGKIIKGKIELGQNLVFIQDVASPLVAANIIAIYDDKKVIETTKLGRRYSFVMDLKDISLIYDSTLLVDSRSFEAPESSLYASYSSEGEKKQWGFVEESNEVTNYLYTFEKAHGYLSNRGINFNSTINDIKKNLGNTNEIEYSGENDVVYSMGKEKGWLCINTLPKAKYFLAYKFGNMYTMRFYFDKNGSMILVAYLKNINSSDIEKNSKPNAATKMQWKVECSNCRKMISNEIKFCNYCGELSPLLSIECPSCKKRIRRGTKFCNYCGQSLKKTANSETSDISFINAKNNLNSNSIVSSSLCDESTDTTLIEWMNLNTD